MLNDALTSDADNLHDKSADKNDGLIIPICAYDGCDEEARWRREPRAYICDKHFIEMQGEPTMTAKQKQRKTKCQIKKPRDS